MWERRQNCSKEQLGEDLYAGFIWDLGKPPPCHGTSKALCKQQQKSTWVCVAMELRRMSTCVPVVVLGSLVHMLLALLQGPRLMQRCVAVRETFRRSLAA